jgi:hypothetical protein
MARNPLLGKFFWGAILLLGLALTVGIVTWAVLLGPSWLTAGSTENNWPDAAHRGSGNIVRWNLQRNQRFHSDGL